MNKKIMLILAIVISLASIIFLAVWGTMPSDGRDRDVEEIIIVTEHKTEENGNKHIDVAKVVNEENAFFILEYDFNPHDATARIKVNQVKNAIIELDQENKKIKITFIKFERITVTILDEISAKTVSVILWFDDEGTSDI